MRPIDRGAIPQVSGQVKTVADYKDWRHDLIERIGNYCSYCNMVLNDSPQVEHVTPKNPQPGQQAGQLLAWANMLLACGPCNRAKNNLPVTTRTHYLPDHHNTHLAFEYKVIDHPHKPGQKACIPVPASSVEVNKPKAQQTIAVCKLDALTINPRATDLRWKYRFEAWHSANVIWRKNWDDWGREKSEKFTDLLMDIAKAKGFFSIWFEAFADVPTIKHALIDCFPGTDKNSFDEYDSFKPIVRAAADL